MDLKIEMGVYIRTPLKAWLGVVSRVTPNAVYIRRCYWIVSTTKEVPEKRTDLDSFEQAGPVEVAWRINRALICDAHPFPQSEFPDNLLSSY